MSNCDDAVALIAPYADGSIDAEGRGRLERHLAHCAECQRALTLQQDVVAALRARPEVAPPADFLERVRSRIAAETGWLGMANWSVWTYRLAPLAAALLLVATLGSDRMASDTPASLTDALEGWAESPAPTTPVTALFWQPDVTGDSLLQAVLVSSPDTSLEDSYAR